LGADGDRWSGKKGDSFDGFCLNLWLATIQEGCLMPNTLLSLFSQVADPRRDQGKMYPLAPILLFTVLAMLAGARSYRQVHAGTCQ
jgi:hypothetical protein